MHPNTPTKKEHLQFNLEISPKNIRSIYIYIIYIYMLCMYIYKTNIYSINIVKNIFR